MSCKVASDRYFALGQTSHVHGPHPSFLTSAHGCIRLHTVCAGNQPTITAEKTGKNRMQPCAYSCARAKAWNLRVYSVGRTHCRISLEAAGPEQ